MSGRPLPPPSDLVKRQWDVPGVGLVRASRPERVALGQVDIEWPPLRPSDRQGTAWQWRQITKKRPETFALVDETSQIIALWASGKYRPLRLPEGNCYRLDYIEIHPELIGGALGVFALSQVASRALELGCSGMVLGSLPGTARFYTGAGGEQRLADGWKAPRSLVPFFFSHETLKELKETADELLVES